MPTQTMFHVTDESNLDNIMEEGLQPGADDNVYLAETVEDAEFLGDVYPHIEEPVVLEAEVMECNVREGPGDAGEVDEYVKGGAIMPVDLEVCD